MDVQKKKRGRRHAPEREKCSKVVHSQENWKVQQKRRVLSRTESGGTEVKDNREKLHSVPE